MKTSSFIAAPVESFRPRFRNESFLDSAVSVLRGSRERKFGACF